MDEPEAEEEDHVNQQWKQVRSIFNETRRTLWGDKEDRKTEDKEEDRMDNTRNTKDIEERRRPKKKINDSTSARLEGRYRAEYAETNKRVKRKIRTDKRAYVEELAKQAEGGARKGEQRNVYKIPRLVCGKYSSNSNVSVRDKQGQLLTSEEGQEARWVEHFEEVLNRTALEEEPEIPEAEEDLSIETGPPRREEFIAAIKSLKNHKAPGKDRLTVELFKADAVTTGSILQPLLNTIWDRRTIPDDCSQGIVIRIPKKGALSELSNWRGISLLSIPCKIVAKVIMKCLSPAVDLKLREKQARFRRGEAVSILFLR